MGVWLYEHEFKDFRDCFLNCGLIGYGSICNCSADTAMSDSISSLIALEQNPHLAQWFAFDGIMTSVSYINFYMEMAVRQIKRYRAGYVRPCGCFELLNLE